MDKNNLLFYNEYEQFYDMAGRSKAFEAFCADAFGQDLSQDDMEELVRQIMKWLKKGGVLFVGYQEGDVMPKTCDVNTTVLAKAFERCGIRYEAEDITRETYELLIKKRQTALIHQNEFEEEGNRQWFDLLMLQTECVSEPYELFERKMSRYIYVVRKEA